MNGHKSGKQVRIRPKALGLGAILAGAVLATSATAALAMPARRIEDATFRPIGDATFRQEVFNSLSGVTQWASKVAAQPEVYLGIDDGLIDTPWASMIVPARALSSVPHQVAPI